ncbi:MAG: MFS transporter [Elusimicrobia bacterium]|nr:MFS transporter [Elusimicrobiota bacterium]
MPDGPPGPGPRRADPQDHSRQGGPARDGRGDRDRGRRPRDAARRAAGTAGTTATIGPSPKVRLASRGFAGLLLTQALSAFNDNAFKALVALLALTTLPPGRAQALVAAAGALFIVPFILFSPLAGDLADRVKKRTLLVFLKAAELVLMGLAVLLLATRSIPLMMGLLFLLGVHSAFLGPVKLSIVPEMLDEKDLSRGNGLLQMLSFVGILLGTVAAGLILERFADRLALASGLFVVVAAAGLATSLWVPEAPAAGGEPLRFNPVAQTLANVAEVQQLRGVWLSTVGAAFFWFLGAIFQMNVLVYGRELMAASPETLSLFQVVVALGIGLGSYAAGRLSRDVVELGLVPLGAAGLFAFSLVLAFSFRSTPATLWALFLLGASGGCFVLPLQAFVQARSPKDRMGRFIATGNSLSFSAILLASAMLWLFQAVFRLHAGQVFLVVALMTLAVAAYIVALLPDFLLRLLLYPVANLIYRIQVGGRENVPLKEPALMVANHVSFVDAALISAASPRLVRFLMLRSYYDLPVAGLLFRAMGCIPISDRDGPKALLRSFEVARKALRDGELLCIFGEGELTRHGQMQGFKKGFERITRDLPVPVIPVHLDRIWGSIFSFEGGRVLFKWPRRLPYPVTVSFGRPMPSGSTAHQVRQAVMELGAEAFRLRLAERQALPLEFLREVRRHPLRLAMADSTGRRLNGLQAFAGAWLLGRTLDRELPPGEAVGLLLPPTVAAALANIGLSMTGRLPINLNYTASPEVVAQCAAKAGARTIVTSKIFLHKLGWSGASFGDAGTVFLEDVAPKAPKALAVPAALAFLLLPRFLLEKTLLAGCAGPLDRTATVIFTSGSEGVPKGVMLTHAGILANMESLGQVYQFTAQDRLMGVLPFFHSFGYTVTLWFPAIAGFAAVYHPNPLDAKRIGDLVREHRATFLLGTPTFLQTYLRRVEPEDFKSLRYAVVGAEKLRPAVAQAFREKFGIEPLEGYGCTELSPVAAVNVPDVALLGVRQKGGKQGTIGRPLPGVLVEIVSPETGLPLPAGEPGMILVKGPNVMKGYLDDPLRTAESLRDGYYVTGDIGSVDDDGFITITDRLSRFSKIGGEMVPHIRVEEALHEAAGRVEQTFVVAAVPDDKRGERLVVLYKDFDGVEGLCKSLNASDLPKLWLPGKESFYRVAEFPLLGSGKLDLTRLKAAALELATKS